MGGKSKANHKKKPETTLGRIWHFIWHEDSWESWLVNIVLAFVLIKFIVYPGLGIILGTSHPIVAVISGSMYHGLEDKGGYYEICGKAYDEKEFRANYDDWWDNCGQWYEENIDVTKSDFRDFPMSNGFAKGDIIVLRRYTEENTDIGDIIVFEKTISLGGNNLDYPVIHRVVGYEEKDGNIYYTTKGDHNRQSGDIDMYIAPEKIIGKAYFKIPYAGYFKILFVDLLRFLHIIE